MEFARHLGPFFLARGLHAGSELSQLLFGLTELSLAFDACRDVPRDALETDDLTGRIEHRHP